MGTAVGDFDRDADFDVAVSNMGPNVLLTNQGDGTFSEQAEAAGVARPDQRAGAMSVTWGLEFQDLNNDGWEDLYAAAGDMAEIGHTPMPQPNAVFVNSGGGTFLDLSTPSGADDPEQSRGVAVADYDRDGRLDLYVVNQAGSPRLYRNVTGEGAGHWLEVDPVGVVSNRDACGARLTAELDRRTRLTRQVLCGSTSLGSGRDSTVHFGLGQDRRARTLTIEWPSGARQVLKNVAADRLLTVREPLAASNRAPVARDDGAATLEDTAVTVEVLANGATLRWRPTTPSPRRRTRRWCPACSRTTPTSTGTRSR